MQSAIRPLDGLRVVELGSMAPAPFCSMILADFGADVALVERPGGVRGGINPEWPPLFSRGKRAIEADLKSDAGRTLVIDLVSKADVFIEGFRPGTTERMGLGPDELMLVNPKLIYTRITGWGQKGPYARKAGHDINYVALAGALAQIGVDEPVPPGAFVGDFGGGSLVAVIGTLLALQSRARTGLGQVVDAGIVDGVSYLMEGALELHRRGQHFARGQNVIDGHAPFYGAYRCRDGRWFSVGAIEPQFYAAFLKVLEIEDEAISKQMLRERWPSLRQRIAQIFITRTRDEWEVLFSAIDACTAPVLEISELGSHPHLSERGLFLTSATDQSSAAPAPLLFGTPGRAGSVPSQAHTDKAKFLAELGWDEP